MSHLKSDKIEDHQKETPRQLVEQIKSLDFAISQAKLRVTHELHPLIDAHKVTQSSLE
jgi:hypothetical protein